MIKSRQKCLFNPPVAFKEKWIIGLICLEVNNSFLITEENSKFEISRDTSDEFSFTELKDEVEEILNIGDITRKHLQDDKVGPLMIKL